MTAPASFPYSQRYPALGPAGMMPYLPLELRFGGNLIQAHGLVDSGATINVLPFQLGVQLGADWNRLQSIAALGGILGSVPAKFLLVQATVAPFAPVIRTFAWSQDPNVPLLLGQFDFFEFFDVCFRRSRLVFEIQPRP